MAFNQLKVHPLSKFWFQMIVNLHLYAKARETVSVRRERRLAQRARLAEVRAVQVEHIRLTLG